MSKKVYITQFGVHQMWSIEEEGSNKDEVLKKTLETALWSGDSIIQIGIKETSFVPGINVSYVLEDIANNAYSEMGEVAEDYFDNVSGDEMQDLEEMLNDTLYKWGEKHKIREFDEGSYYNVEDIETYHVIDGKLVKQKD